MRRNQVVSIAAIVLVLAGVLALSRVLDVNRYRGSVQAALAGRLGRDVSLGRMHLSLLPPGLRVEGATVGDDPGFQTGRPFAQTEELYLSLRPLALLRGRFEVGSMMLRRPVIELVRNAAGTWNVTTLGRNGKARAYDALAPHRLVIIDGQVAVTDLERGERPASLTAARNGRRVVYRNIDIQINDYTPGRAFDIVLAVTFPGTGAQRLGIRGSMGPVVEDHAAMTPFDGVVEFDRVSIAGLQRFLEVRALEDTDAIVSGTAKLRNRDGQLSSTGSLRLEQPRARGVDLGYPITAVFDVAHDAASEVLNIRSGTLRLDQTPLALDGTIDLKPEPPVLDMHVAASDVSLAEAARLASAFGVAFGADTRVQGRLHADVRARGVANRPALEGRLHLRDVSISGTDIPRPVRTQAVDLSLTPNEIRSNDFAASTNGTSLGARFTLSQYTTPKPVLDASIRTAGANFGEVLTIARAWGVRAASGMSGTGRLTLDVRAAGPSDAPTFSGSGSLDDAALKAPSIAHPLQIRHATLTFSRDAAVVENLSLTVGKTTADGRFTVRNFTAPQVDFQFAADRIDVAEMQQLFEPARKPQPSPQQRKAGESLLRQTTGSGRLNVGSIEYGQLVLDHVQTDVALDRGLIRLDPLTAGLFGGRHRGAIVVNTRRTPSAVTIASNLEKVDANRLASAVVDVRDVIHGQLSSVVRVTFSTDGAASVARSLNGTLSFKIPNGRIANMDLMHEVATIAQFVGGQRSAQTSTSVAALSGSFNVSDGVAHTADLAGSIEGGRFGAIGTINLVNQGLNLRMNAVLSSGFSRLMGGIGVGGFMNTVLANQQGELVVPMLVTGTLQQPRFAPDVQRLAEMKVRNLVPSLRDPQGLATGILGAFGEQPEGGPTRQKTLDEIIGAITGQPPKDQQNRGADQRQGQTKKPAKPERKDPAQQLQDELRRLLGGDQQQEKKPPRK